MFVELWNQTVAVIRIEFAKTFLAKRAMWIYVLALLPAIVFYANSVYTAREHVRLANEAVKHPMKKENVRFVRPGMMADEVVKQLGEPYQKNSRRFWTGRPPQQHDRQLYFYTDGETE